MKVVRGNLLDLAEQGHFDVIVHGCNCLGIMGAGIAKQIAERWPEVEATDKNTIWRAPGGMSSQIVQRKGATFVVVNGYTQMNPGPCADYKSIREVFAAVKEAVSGKRIGYPKIGAGIGGGDWGVISKIIDEELNGENHTLVEYVQ